MSIKERLAVTGVLTLFGICYPFLLLLDWAEGNKAGDLWSPEDNSY